MTHPIDHCTQRLLRVSQFDTGGSWVTGTMPQPFFIIDFSGVV